MIRAEEELPDFGIDWSSTKYRISGGFWASVYRGPLLNCEYSAMKVLNMFGGNCALPKSFYRGIAFQALSKHPCVLPVIGFCPRDPPTLVTRLVTGRSLQGVLNQMVKWHRKPSWWTNTRLACCLYSVATALRDAHEFGVIHGDVKPSDILFDLDAHEALLGDFGLYKGYWRTYYHKLGPKEPRFPWIGPYESTVKDCDVCSFGMTAYLMTAGVENLPDGHLARRLAVSDCGYDHFEDTFERTPAIDNA